MHETRLHFKTSDEPILNISQPDSEETPTCLFRHKIGTQPVNARKAWKLIETERYRGKSMSTTLIKAFSAKILYIDCTTFEVLTTAKREPEYIGGQVNG